MRMLLVEAENRGQPGLLGALDPPGRRAAPRPRAYPRSASRFLRARARRIRTGAVADRCRGGRAGDRSGRGRGDRARLRPLPRAALPAARAHRREPGRLLRGHVPGRGVQRHAEGRPGLRPGAHGGRERQLDGHQPARGRRRAGRVPRGRTGALALPPDPPPAEDGPHCWWTWPTTPTSTGCGRGSPARRHPRRASIATTGRRPTSPSPGGGVRRASTATAAGRSRSTRSATVPTCARSCTAWPAAGCPPRAASRSALAPGRGRASTACRAWPCRCRGRTRTAQPVGGVRFPELGLPLGRLRPVSLSPSVTTSSGAVCGNSGGFEPFARRDRGAPLLARRLPRALSPCADKPRGARVREAR